MAEQCYTNLRKNGGVNRTGVTAVKMTCPQLEGSTLEDARFRLLESRRGAAEVMPEALACWLASVRGGRLAES